MFSALHWLEKTLAIGTISIVVGALLAGGIHYYLLHREVKDLRSFKAQTQALATLKIEENKTIEEKNEIKKQQAKETKTKRDSLVADNFKRLRDANRSGSGSVSAMSNPTSGVSERPTYAELAEWYSELVDRCTRTVEAATLTTNQLSCITEVYR